MFLSFSCINCPIPEDKYYPRKLKQYNPKKAGAVIVDKFNITKDIKFPDGKFPMPDRERVLITAPYDICIDDTNIYILITDNLYVFCKETLVKKHEIKINFSSSGHPEWFNYDFNNRNQGMAIFGNKAMLLGSSSQCNLFLIDLDSGDATLLDDSEMLGGETNGGFFRLLGYDRANELFWYRIIIFNDKSYNKYFHYFKYDESLDKLTLCDIKTAPFIIGKQNDIDNWWVNINGDIAWYTGHSSSTPDGHIKSIGIDKRRPALR